MDRRYTRGGQSRYERRGKYNVQEYTSIIDGKVRFRVISYREAEEMSKIGWLGHLWGGIDGVSYDQAVHLADSLRLERRMMA